MNAGIGMIIEFDIGNTNIKWRTSALVGEVLSHGCLRHENFSVQTLGNIIHSERVSEFKVSSVAGSEEVQTLRDYAVAKEIPIRFAESVKECAGLVNSYSEVARLGVDRWLAMLAAFNRVDSIQSPICVIDAGTAITVDFVSSNGEHEGGLIVPGRGLLLASLSSETNKVIFDAAAPFGELQMGKNTDAAVHNGVIYMMVGAINEAIRQHDKQVERNSSISETRYFLTGGDAEVLEKLLNVKAELVPDLVLDGLQYSLP